MSLTVTSPKLYTLTTRPFLLNLSCMITCKIESLLMTAVSSGYFACVSPLLCVAIGSLFLLPEFLNSENCSFFSLQSLLQVGFVWSFGIYHHHLGFFVGNKNFSIGVCYFIIIVINIFDSNLIICW